MAFKNFDELIAHVKTGARVKRVAVVSAADLHTLEAVFRARREGISEPMLIGNLGEINNVLEELGETLSKEQILHASTDEEAARLGVALIREGRADFLMKGKIQTADLLRAVVDKENGLRTGSVMSHMAIHELPNYPKLLAVSDGGMMLYPNLEEKKAIIQNGVNALANMGYDCPKVAVLAAVETVNPKMQETLDAAALKLMNTNGDLPGCIVEGPISYDLVMSRESAEIKGYHSPVTEDADLLIVPNITTGNILGKALVYSGGAKMAGFVIGAKVPIVLTSRGSSSEEKYLSLALSAAAVK